MAGCDKIWASKYQDYLDMREWAKQNKFTCPNGMVIDPSEFFWRKFSKEDFDESEELAIMSSPNVLDYFLIKYCSLQFVQDYLKTNYPEEYIQSVLNGTSDYDRFVPPEKGSKVKLIYRGQKSNRLSKFRHHKQKFIIDIAYKSNSLWYNRDYDKWFIFYDRETDTSELGIWTSSSAVCCHSIKALIRKIRKWNLPKGSIIEASGRWDCETYKFVVK